uniref:Uncharacterized protein n=1 Tax=Lepeophtheirus salmonis TaxID=72036 RepID=A0A0K2U9D7_LEPSM
MADFWPKNMWPSSSLYLNLLNFAQWVLWRRRLTRHITSTWTP